MKNLQKLVAKLLTHPTRTAQVNALLKKAGRAETLTQGNGYLYFWGGDVLKWENGESVAVCYVSHLSFQRWLDEFKYLSGGIDVAATLLQQAVAADAPKAHPGRRL